jgi:uncharacterized protein
MSTPRKAAQPAPPETAPDPRQPASPAPASQAGGPARPPAATIDEAIAAELGVAPWQVTAAIDLLDSGSTVPFIARYRKEATGTLDDAQLRLLEERLGYLRELEDRRQAVLTSIDEQGKLTAELRSAVVRAATKAELEDLYLPYKSKRRTRAQIAREAGLEPLADALLADPTLDPEAAAGPYLDAGKGIELAADALAGARAILIERAGQDAALVSMLRERHWRGGRIRSTAARASGAAASAGAATAASAARPSTPAPRTDAAQFADYIDFVQPLQSLPGHRVLALLRGEREGALALEIVEADPRDAEALAAAQAGYEAAVARSLGVRGPADAPAGRWLAQTVRLAWRGRLLGRLESDMRARLFEAAEESAVKVFAANLRDVLLAAPAGNRAVLGLDPGLRTGVKVAVVDGTGKAVDTATIYPHAPARKWDAALATLEALAVKHGTGLVAIGNGTASRETDKLAGELIDRLAANPAFRPRTAHDAAARAGDGDAAAAGQGTGRADRRDGAAAGPARAAKPARVVVSEAGASVYSASALASAELPDLDVSLRGAVSIARRLQDPLAELVKIDPKSIGVGQYQHDLTPAKLDRSLDAVVEDCVNAIGVDVNTASPALLARVAGVGTTLSRNIVEYRDANGPFASRAELKKVPRLGAKAFEQCAGFLRITGGREPLDASAVHPEAYALARRILAAAGTTPGRVGAGGSKAGGPEGGRPDAGRPDADRLDVGTRGAVAVDPVAVDPRDFADERFGLPTVRDIIAELARPGRDPRPEFVTASFTEGVEKIGDLVPGMVLEGTVSNVAAFGAFVDIGVHQDGLVHVSAMSNTFVSDPREVVTSGQVVKVKVLEVDEARKRISLTLRLQDDAGAPAPRRNPRQSASRGTARQSQGGDAAGKPVPGGQQPAPRAGQRTAKPGREGPGKADRAAKRPTEPAADTAMAEALRRAGLGR